MHRPPILPTRNTSLLASPSGLDHVNLGPSGPGFFTSESIRTEVVSRRLGPAKLFCLGLILTGLVALVPESFALAEGAGLDQVRNSGKLRYGSDMEGGGPYAYPDPKSPRDVTGFEVELVAMLAKDLGVTPEFCQGQWDMLLRLLDLGRSDIVVNGYEWTRDAGTRLPGHAAVLRLSTAVDGSPGQPHSLLGRPEAASTGRRPLDGRRAGRFGGRHVHREGGRQERPGQCSSAVPPTP